jgi:hypothetical protein
VIELKSATIRLRHNFRISIHSVWRQNSARLKDSVGEQGVVHHKLPKYSIIANPFGNAIGTRPLPLLLAFEPRMINASSGDHHSGSPILAPLNSASLRRLGAGSQNVGRQLYEGQQRFTFNKAAEEQPDCR